MSRKLDAAKRSATSQARCRTGLHAVPVNVGHSHATARCPPQSPATARASLTAARRDTVLPTESASLIMAQTRNVAEGTKLETRNSACRRGLDQVAKRAGDVLRILCPGDIHHGEILITQNCTPS